MRENESNRSEIRTHPTDDKDGIQLLSCKIDDLTLKCDFLEQFLSNLLSKNGHETNLSGNHRNLFDTERKFTQFDDVNVPPERTSELLEEMHI